MELHVLHIHVCASYVHQHGLALGVVCRISDVEIDQKMSEHNYRELGTRLSSAGLAHYGVDSIHQANLYALLHALRYAQTLLRERARTCLPKTSRAILHFDTRHMAGQVDAQLQCVGGGQVHRSTQLWRDLVDRVRELKQIFGVEIEFRDCHRQEETMHGDDNVAVKLAKRRDEKAFTQEQQTVQEAPGGSQDDGSTAAEDGQSLQPTAKIPEDNFFDLVIREK